ncbi:hypothetical protein J4475_01470 [Candidatus Woesearchaeota archaeon]|nr:hypothetical protein [Candidatus Woesearchaeota archaeon]
MVWKVINPETGNELCALPNRSVADWFVDELSLRATGRPTSHLDLLAAEAPPHSAKKQPDYLQLEMFEPPHYRT